MNISIVCKQAQRLLSEIFSGVLKAGWRSRRLSDATTFDDHLT